MIPFRLLIVLLLLWSVPAAAAAEPSERSASGSGIPAARRVVLFYFDGLHPEAIDRLNLPTLRALRDAGASVEGGAVMPFPWHPTTGVYGSLHSTSLPNPIAMTGNLFLREDQPMLQHVFSRGATTAIAVGSKAYDTLTPGFEIVHMLDATDAEVMDRILETLDVADPLFYRVQLQDVGRAGMATINAPADTPHHADIWHQGSPYADAAREADRQLGRFVEKMKQLDRWSSTLFVFMADGQSRHGWHLPMDEQSWRTPLILVGPSVRPGRVIPYAETIDVVPTLAAALGIDPPNPGPGSGRVLTEAFEGGPEAVDAPRHLLTLNRQIKEHLLLTARLRLMSVDDPRADYALLSAENRFLTRRNHGGEPFRGLGDITRWQEAGGIAELVEQNKLALDHLRGVAVDLAGSRDDDAVGAVLP